MRRVVMREKRQAAWRHLSLTERDMLTVLSAVCKVRLSTLYKPRAPCEPPSTPFALSLAANVMVSLPGRLCDNDGECRLPVGRSFCFCSGHLLGAAARRGAGLICQMLPRGVQE